MGQCNNTNKSSKLILYFSIISKQPISEELENVWFSIQKRGWIDIEATHSLESLLNTGGAQWFVTNLVKVILTLRYSQYSLNPYPRYRSSILIINIL